jgi:hypothetical protein
MSIIAQFLIWWGGWLFIILDWSWSLSQHSSRIVFSPWALFQLFKLSSSFVSLDSRVRYQHFVLYPLLLSYSVWGCHHLALRHLLFTFAGFASSVPPRTGFFCFADVLISFHFIAFLRWLSLVIAFLSGFFFFLHLLFISSASLNCFLNWLHFICGRLMFLRFLVPQWLYFWTSLTFEIFSPLFCFCFSPIDLLHLERPFVCFHILMSSIIFFFC